MLTCWPGDGGGVSSGSERSSASLPDPLAGLPLGDLGEEGGLALFIVVAGVADRK